VRRVRSGLLWAAAAVASLGVVALAAGLAGAEQTGRAGIRASLDGRISPKRLPRDRPVPVSLHLSGWVRADEGGLPPRLNRIELAFEAERGVDTRGLPRCPRGRLLHATTRQALDRCGAALVGRGTIDTLVPLAPDDPLPARARALAFNGRWSGGRAIWVHAYSASPPVSFVLPFYLRGGGSGAGNVSIEAPVARTLGRWPRLRSFHLTLGRRYSVAGVRRSYLSARCPAPPRLHIGYFRARATYRFSPRPTIPVAILRSCRARD